MTDTSSTSWVLGLFTILILELYKLWSSLRPKILSCQLPTMSQIFKEFLILPKKLQDFGETEKINSHIGERKWQICSTSLLLYLFWKTFKYWAIFTLLEYGLKNFNAARRKEQNQVSFEWWFCSLYQNCYLVDLSILWL